MKKATALIMIFLLTLLSGCSFGSSSDGNVTSADGSESTDSDAVSAQDKTESASDDTETGRILVVYFSRAGENYGVGVVDKGNTAIVADIITEETGADEFEIVPVNAYPESYEDTLTIAQQEASEKTLPEYIGDIENWDDYDTVFIGYPIWYGDMPRIVYSFIEDHDWAGKTVIPFDTNAGSGLAQTESTIADETGATVLDGIAVSGTDAQNNKDSVIKDIQSRLEGLGL